MRFPSLTRSPARHWLALIALSLATALLPIGGSPVTLAAAPVQARPTDAFEAWFPVEQPPTAPFEAVQLIVDFPAGSRVARHVHGGPGYITMIENDLTMWIGAQPMRTYKLGESFVEPFRLVAEGANLTDVKSSVLVTYLLPVGAAVTTLEPASGAAAPAAVPGASSQLPPGAVPRFESRMRLETAPAQYRLGQMLRTYEPGAWSVSALASSPRLMTVVTGEVTVLTGAREQTHTAGQTWTEAPGAAWLSGNVGATPAIVAVSIIDPRP